MEQSNPFFFYTKHLQGFKLPKGELKMNYEQLQNTGFRKPLFNETVVNRALTTVLELTNSLLDSIDSYDPKMLGLQGSEIIRLTLALKVNEITDELTLERLTA